MACDHAFLDRHGRLCMVGVWNRLPVPILPVVINQLMLVAKLADIHPVDEVDVTISVETPNGYWSSPADDNGVVIELAGEYVLATLRGLPLTDDGVHRFRIALRNQPPITVDLPVIAPPRARMEEVRH